MNLVIQNLSKHFGTTVALEDVTLTLPSGKLICFLGPSGCGKTTLLRLIAGLETPSSGHIFLGNNDLTKIPAHQRNIGMVFQSFALFPHLNVSENIAYGLRIRGVDKTTQLRRANELLDVVKLPGLGQRHIAQLSGGQRQRVAMARALALEPSLFLLDEPLSALDAKLREAMQIEIKLLQQRLGITTIIVTHDQQEALTMADVIVVMGHNQVQQIGAPLEIYHQPSNSFVADFIGTNNLIPAKAIDGKTLEILGRTISKEHGFSKGSSIQFSIRPEKLKLNSELTPGGFEAIVRFVRDLGSQVETFVDVGNQQLIIIGGPHLQSGQKVWVYFDSKDGVVLA